MGAPVGRLGGRRGQGVGGSSPSLHALPSVVGQHTLLLGLLACRPSPTKFLTGGLLRVSHRETLGRLMKSSGPGWGEYSAPSLGQVGKARTADSTAANCEGVCVSCHSPSRGNMRVDTTQNPQQPSVCACARGLCHSAHRHACHTGDTAGGPVRGTARQSLSHHQESQEQLRH